MPTQKIFKQRVRARMTKTGESYTAARGQLLRKAGGWTGTEPEAARVEGAASAPEPEHEPEREDVAITRPEPSAPETTAADDRLTSDEAMLRATGKRHDEWFGLLDAWGATDRRHGEIAAWLHETHGVPSWWTQNVTVAYERARGMRGRHQMANGFAIGVSRTVAVDPHEALHAFTDPDRRSAWLPGDPVRSRPTRAASTARFDWLQPASRVVVTVASKGPGRCTVTVGHEKLPDAAAAEEQKTAWRARLDSLKAFLERS